MHLIPVTARAALAITLVMVVLGSGWAQNQRPQLAEPQPPPPIPADAVPDEELEPEVTIIQRGEVTIQEYRVNGRLYAVQIIPKAGRPYYLVDTDGDGDLESKRFELDSGLLIPGWVIMSW